MLRVGPKGLWVRVLGILFMVLQARGAFSSGFVSKAPIVDGIVAVVGSKIITRSDIELARKQLASFALAEGAPGAGSLSQLSTDPELLDMLIEEKLVEIAINRIGIEIKESEVETTITRIIAGNKLTKDQLIRLLESEGMTYQAYKDNIRNRLQKERFRAQFIEPYIRVTDEQVRKVLKVETGSGDFYQLNFILLTPAETDMWNALDEKKRGETWKKFKFTHAPIGFKGFLTELAQDVKTHIKTMSPGDFSGVITLSGQSAIIHVESVEQKTAEASPVYKEAFEQTRSRLYQEAYKKYMTQWVKQQKHQQRIEIYQLPET
jgi:peptidyl-prolyl cis-trans isomerase SurA